MGTTSRMSLPYPEPTDPPNGAAQIRALAEATDTHLSRVYEAVLSIAPFSGVASGAAIPGWAPQVLTFPPGRFTTPPVLYLQQQSLPAGAPWVSTLCASVSTTGANLYAYNLNNGPLSVAGTITVAVLAIQRD